MEMKPHDKINNRYDAIDELLKLAELFEAHDIDGWPTEPDRYLEIASTLQGAAWMIRHERRQKLTNDVLSVVCCPAHVAWAMLEDVTNWDVDYAISELNERGFYLMSL